jgi:hypothetical protein
MIVFGGVTDQSTPADAVWEFSLKAHEWKQLEIPGQTPGPHSTHAAVWDAQDGQMIVFGGDGTADAWILSTGPIPHWVRAHGDGSGPSARNGCAAVWDRRLGRMLLFGGGTADGALSDTWYLDFENRKPLNPRLAAATLHTAHAGFQMLILQQSGPSQATPPVIEWSAANPGDGKSLFRISSPTVSPLRLQLTDVVGRLLVDQPLGEFNVGDHEVAWDPGSQVALASGVYFVRVLLGSWSAQAKLVVLKP